MDRVKLQYFALDVTAGTWNPGYQGHPSLLSVGLPLCHLVMAVCSRLVSSSVASESCQTLDLEPKKKPKRMFHTGWFPKIAFSWTIKWFSGLTMVYGRYNELVNGVYTPTFTSLAPSCILPGDSLNGGLKSHHMEEHDGITYSHSRWIHDTFEYKLEIKQFHS